MLCQAIAVQTSRWGCMCFCRVLRGLVNSANSNEVCQSRQIGVDEWRGSSSTIDNARTVHFLSWTSRAYVWVLWDHWANGTHQKEQIVIIEFDFLMDLRIHLFHCWSFVEAMIWASFFDRSVVLLESTNHLKSNESLWVLLGIWLFEMKCTFCWIDRS